MPLNNSIADLDPDVALTYEEAKATWKQHYPDGPWPELNETARSQAVQDAYYACSRAPVSEVQRLYKLAGLYPIAAKEASERKTNARYGQSSHNASPSQYAAACDVRFRFYHNGQAGSVSYEHPQYFIAFGGYMLTAAARLLAAGRISDKIVWGNDWNGNNLHDDKSYDPPHFERKSWRLGLRKKPIIA